MFRPRMVELNLNFPIELLPFGLNYLSGWETVPCPYAVLAIRGLDASGMRTSISGRDIK
jgi:hypothetical protein